MRGFLHDKKERIRGDKMRVAGLVVAFMVTAVVIAYFVSCPANPFGAAPELTVDDGTATGGVCADEVGEIWCGRLEQCVDPWLDPCEEGLDTVILQRMDAIRKQSNRAVGYPERSVLEWRVDENNEIVQQKMDGLSVSWREVDYDTIERLTASLEEQGFEQDIQNMADGPGAGSWGYQLGGMVCVMRFQATNLKLPPDDTAGAFQEPLRFDIDLTCGRLP